MTIQETVKAQRAFFLSGATRPVEERRNALLKLRAALRANEGKLAQALKADLNKAPMEAYMTETGIVLEELRFTLRHLARWARPRAAGTPLAQFHAKSFVMPEPYGVALIIAPWNYPVQLSLAPLIGAVAAGNCALVKPSANTPETSRALSGLIADCFDPRHVAVIEGGREQNGALLDEQFDYIFFTGSADVGRLVMERAARHLTPVSLELGGKSPVIVDGTADIALSARRVAFGKVLNAGQTCVAPDYALVQRDVLDAFLSALKAELARFFPNGDESNMPNIVNDRQFQRLTGLLGSGSVYCGGGADPATRHISPTVLTDVKPDDPVMREEVFGPILPVLPYATLDEALAFINARQRPLALYIFTNDRAAERSVLAGVRFGGGCVNDTVIHTATSHMGFGGVGESGMGSYHGRHSFDTFTHDKSIVKKYNWIDLPLRYQPYSAVKERLVRLFLR